MPTEFHASTETPVLSEVLQTLNEQSLLTVKQIERMLCLASRTGYIYLSGTDMRFSQVRSIFDRCGKVEVQRALLNALSEGNGWLHTKVESARDINGDGEINTDDVLAGGIAALDKLGRLLTIAHKGRDKNKTISSDQASQLHHVINASITQLLEVQQVVNFLGTQQTRRSA